LSNFQNNIQCSINGSINNVGSSPLDVIRPQEKKHFSEKNNPFDKFSSGHAASQALNVARA